jgi:predicted acylesterase/phospholipase RssA
MPESQKQVRRGFVMTGGGAKGLYEAGVIHAFHITGMEFDVITGSSIGAFNSVFFAEYLLRKKELASEVGDDPEQAVEAMDKMVKAYHHAWLKMPEKRIVDDSEAGPLGQLKDDLLEFKLCLPDLTRIIWWWTDPQRGTIPSPRVWPALVQLGMELTERLGGAGKLLDILKYGRKAPFESAMRTYLARFDMDRSLIPAEGDSRLTSLFTDAIAPLNQQHIQGERLSVAADEGEKVSLVQPGRTLRDYTKAGIDVRLTRANYRTGRLEVSAYLSAEDFVRYMQRQAFRLEREDPDKIPLGSFRLQVPGNPNAINAALASGRFPGVLAPYPVEALYPPDDPENDLLYRMLANWLDDPAVESEMTQAYLALPDDEPKDEKGWKETYERWRQTQSMRDFFPQAKDLYVDGGAIDNTPSNSVIDATREWADRDGVSRHNLVLDLFTIFLHPEPRVDPEEIENPAFHQVILRTREIQGAAKKSSDAVVVDTINTFGRRGDRLGDTLLAVLESYQQALASMDEAQRQEILDRLREEVRRRGIRGYLGQDGEGLLERMADWAEKIVDNLLPLQVRAVKIHPEEMPLDTLQFTERLGYRCQNALAMLTMGCYNTLWTLRNHLEGQKDDLEERDRRTLALARKWMGGESWPPDPTGAEDPRHAWRCQRAACVFHAEHCSHGAKRTE